MDEITLDLKPYGQVTNFSGLSGELEFTIDADALPEELVRTPFEIKAGKLKNPMKCELFETMPAMLDGIVVKFKYVAHSESPQWENDDRVDTTTTLTFKGACNDIDLKLKVKGKEKAWEKFGGKEHDFVFARITAANHTLDNEIYGEAKTLLDVPGLAKIEYGDKTIFESKKSKQKTLTAPEDNPLE